MFLVTGIQKQPVQWGKMTPLLRLQYLERNSNYMNSTQGPNSTHTKAKNIDHIISFIRSVNEHNCNNRYIIVRFMYVFFVILFFDHKKLISLLEIYSLRMI